MPKTKHAPEDQPVQDRESARQGSGRRDGHDHEAVHAQGARFRRPDSQAQLPHQNRFVRRIIVMGQKTNPIGFRIAVNKDWRSKWYAGKKEFGKLLTEDRQIRDLLKKKLESASVPEDFDRARRHPLPHHHPHRPSGRRHRPQRRGNRQAQGRAEQDDRQGNLRGHRGNQARRKSMPSSWRKTSRCNWNAAFRSAAR